MLAYPNYIRRAIGFIGKRSVQEGLVWVLLTTGAIPAAEVNPEARKRAAILKRIFDKFSRELKTENRDGWAEFWYLSGYHKG
ncbi:hypothetical protein ACN42_g3775 [Penicillium freii]|uniref:Uncharacterized protein n=1 Tax=Penicillium freii TaxID=48697 RepID=A0A101MMN7_PENFR|nr:hypothetical protein ACN42_g3775 [Penicillium freii]